MIEIGTKVNHWEVIAGPTKRRNNIKYWACRCTCGKERDIEQNVLKYAKSNSCGCQKVVSEKTRALLSEAMKGQPSPRAGVVVAEETKAKMKASQLARRERERLMKEEPQVSSSLSSAART